MSNDYRNAIRERADRVASDVYGDSKMQSVIEANLARIRSRAGVVEDGPFKISELPEGTTIEELLTLMEWFKRLYRVSGINPKSVDEFAHEAEVAYKEQLIEMIKQGKM